uniref:DNA repair protein SWI5 homolog n=1 Tax=Geospiza parvula TaxID=87175 RepID=A0A8C3NJ23_GEOPR
GNYNSRRALWREDCRSPVWREPRAPLSADPQPWPSGPRRARAAARPAILRRGPCPGGRSRFPLPLPSRAVSPPRRRWRPLTRCPVLWQGLGRRATERRGRIPSPKSLQPNGASEEALRGEIKELKQKDLALDQEIAQLLSEGYSLEELDKHISLLHEYNEIKDAGQMLLGKLAVIRGVTTKQLYPEYDLELSD